MRSTAPCDVSGSEVQPRPGRVERWALTTSLQVLTVNLFQEQGHIWNIYREPVYSYSNTDTCWIRTNSDCNWSTVHADASLELYGRFTNIGSNFLQKYISHACRFCFIVFIFSYMYFHSKTKLHPHTFYRGIHNPNYFTFSAVAIAT